MSIDVMKLALEALELWEENLGSYKNHQWPISIRDELITIRLIPPVRKIGGGRRLALQAAERVELSHKHRIAKKMLCAAIEQAHGDWDEVEALRASLREHMAEIQRLRDAIEQEPVVWMNPSWIDPDTRGWASHSFESIQIEGWIPLYTAPRQWQGLTDDEIVLICGECAASHADDLRYARAIEAKLREKNNG